MNVMPHELIFGEVYLPPLLLVVVLAYMLTSALNFIGVKFNLYKYFAAPAIVDLCLLIIFTGVISRFIPVV